MDRTEKAGLGLSVAGHVGLLAALSLGLFAAQNKLPLQNPPMDVMFVDEVGMQAAAPQVSTEAPAPSVAPEQGPMEEPPPPAAVEPAPAPPEPVPAPTPKPAPVERAKPRERLDDTLLKGIRTERPTRTTAARGERLGADFLKGLGAREGRANTPPAAISGAAQASLAAAIREQLARYWVPPSGPIGGLRTSLRVRLNRDGSVSGRPELIGQDGVNAANSAYARQHADAAIRTVFKAAPLKLPADLYEYWKLLEPLNFDATLDR